MNNGQISIASVQPVTQLVTQVPVAPSTVAVEGVQENGGDFAELLGGIQLVVNGKGLSGTAAAEQSQVKAGMDQLVVNAGVADLLALLQVPQIIATSSEDETSKPDETEKTDINPDAVLQDNISTEVTSQMVLAAYSQPGRMPEVSFLTPIPVEALQKVAMVTEESNNIPEIKPSADLAAVQQKLVQSEAGMLVNADKQSLSAVIVAVAVPTVVPEPELFDRISGVNKPLAISVDRTQNVATTEEQPTIITAPAVKINSEQNSEEVDPTAEQSAVITAPTVKINSEQNSEEAVPKAEQQATVTVSTKSKELHTELPSAHQAVSVPAVSQSSEIEIILSQPIPIAARVTTTPVLVDKRTAVPAQENNGKQQQLSLEKPIETVRAGNERAVAKETASSIDIAASAGELSLGSDTSSETGNNQEKSDAASDSQLQSQDMRGQLKTEQLRIPSLSTKGVPTELALPEQVAQQVRECLVQHDVKQGSQQITLTLSPDSLGELKMNLNLQGQKLSVEIVTENRIARDAIVQHVDALKESLARQNITMESFDVTTGGKGSGNQGQNQNAWRELAKQQQQQQLWTSARGYQTAQADLPSGQAAYQRQQGQSMLDIHY